MIETLSLGGGILYLKEQFDAGIFIDIGYCSDFNVNLQIQEEFKETYVTDSLGNIVKALSTEGVITKYDIDGDFICESVDRFFMQKIWFRGTDNSDGTELMEVKELKPIISALKFLSVPATGPRYCLNLPVVKLTPSTPIKFIHDAWKEMAFTFKMLHDSTVNSIPTLRVEEENETLVNFCS